MAGAFDEPLNVYRVVAEGGAGLAARGGQKLVLQVGGVANDLHPPTAAAGGRFDDQRKADGLFHDRVGHLGFGGERLRRTREPMARPALDHRLAGGELIAHLFDHRGPSGPMKVKPLFSQVSANRGFSDRNP